MCRINPKVDLAFKKLFGSEENLDILKSFINSHLPQDEQVSEIKLKNPYNLADYINGKLSILDIKAVDEKGKWYDIEMQMDSLDYYGQRTLFYWGKVFTGQIEAGELYSKLRKTIIISILDFISFPDDERYHRIIAPRDIQTFEKHDTLDYMDLHFVELKKFNKELKDIKTTLDRWITFLNNAYKYEKDKIPTELAADKEVKKAIERLDVMYLSKEEREYYEAEQKLIRDRAEVIRTADSKGFKRGKDEGIKEGKEEGIKEGKEEGIKEGKEEGERNKAVEMAALMKREGEGIDKIAKYTGLSLEEIQKLC